MPTETRVLRTLDLGACAPETVGIPHPTSVRRGSFPDACSETDAAAISIYTAEALLDSIGQTVYSDAALTVFALDGYYNMGSGLIVAIGGAFGIVDAFFTCP